jgi:hypothetical protein
VYHGRLKILSSIFALSLAPFALRPFPNAIKDLTVIL